MEATGPYWEELAIALHDAGYTVSIVNPARVKAFAQSQMRRTKNDRVDASVIAHFCRALGPQPWTPPAPELRQLQALTRRLDDLRGLQAQESNRLSTAESTPEVKESIERTIALLQAEIDTLQRQIEHHIDTHPTLKQRWTLLTSIPGIGPATAASLTAELVHIATFSNARQLAAYAGLVPSERRSGSSIRGRPHLSKAGRTQLRKALFYPAMAATRFNPLIRSFYHRLLDAGKPKMLALAACMRKLLHIIFGVLNHHRPFNPNYQPCLP
jgi:transposase